MGCERVAEVLKGSDYQRVELYTVGAVTLIQVEKLLTWTTTKVASDGLYHRIRPRDLHV